MNELIITILLLVPAVNSDKVTGWNVGAVHNQVQVSFEHGLEASYSATMVPCHTRPTKEGFIVYHTESMGQEVCYLTDISRPVLVRYTVDHWFPATYKTYKGRQ
jgi:hypothetical protein